MYFTLFVALGSVNSTLHVKQTQITVFNWRITAKPIKLLNECVMRFIGFSTIGYNFIGGHFAQKNFHFTRIVRDNLPC